MARPCTAAKKAPSHRQHAPTASAALPLPQEQRRAFAALAAAGLQHWLAAPACSTGLLHWLAAPSAATRWAATRWAASQSTPTCPTAAGASPCGWRALAAPPRRSCQSCRSWRCPRGCGSCTGAAAAAQRSQGAQQYGVREAAAPPCTCSAAPAPHPPAHPPAAHLHHTHQHTHQRRTYTTPTSTPTRACETRQFPVSSFAPFPLSLAPPTNRTPWADGRNELALLQRTPVQARKPAVLLDGRHALRACAQALLRVDLQQLEDEVRGGVAHKVGHLRARTRPVQLSR